MAASPPQSIALPPLGRGQAWRVAIVATLVMAVSYIDRQTLAAISPTVCQALDISDANYGWLTSAFSFAYLAFAPVAGGIVDRVGCRLGLVASVLAWSTVSALHAFAPSFAALFLLRIALGTTEAPSFPGGAQAVRRSLPASERSAGFGLLFTGSSIGGMIAAPLAIVLLTHGSWHLAFLGTAAVGLAWVPVWLFVSGSPRARAALDRRDDADGLAEAAPREAWTRLVVEPAVLRAVVLVIASAPMVGFVLNWLPKYLVAERHLTQAVLGKYVWLPMLCFDLGAVGFGALASRREKGLDHASHNDLVALAGLAASSVAAMPFAPGPWSAVFAASLAMIGGGGVFALVTGDMLSRVSPSRVSMAGGMTAAAQSLAYVVANPLVGAAVQRTHSYTGAVTTLGAVVLPGAVAWMMWPVPTPRRA
jgi:ACS family hexuronate transporter-like MFS transporter